MQNENNKKPDTVGRLNKRRVLMEDGRRYLIYYTFGEEKNVAENSFDQKIENILPEGKAVNSTVEEEK